MQTISDPNCKFCAIVRQEAPAFHIHDAGTLIVIRVEDNPRATTHCLIISENHYNGLDDFSITHNTKFCVEFFEAIGKVASLLESPAAFKIEATSNDPDEKNNHPYVHFLSDSGFSIWG